MNKKLILILFVLILLPLCFARDLGDCEEDAVISFSWDATDADGNSVTRTTDGTITVYRSDYVPVTLGITDNEDTPYVGINECIIDTSVDGNCLPYYSYTVYINGTVIGGRTINSALATLTIKNTIDSNGTFGNEALKALIDNASVDANTAAAAVINETYGLAATKTAVDDVNSTVKIIAAHFADANDINTIAGKINDLWLGSGAGGFP